MRRYILLTPLIFLCIAYANYSQAESFSLNATLSPMDIIIILDNSGSMKANDPGFLTGSVVSSLLKSLSGNYRVGIIVFAEQAELEMPLTLIEEVGTDEKIATTMSKVNYKGKYTNIPAAIERSIYELKQNGRKDAKKLVIFMTDGIIDTGNAVSDVEKKKWLKDELARESKEAGIRIFGIAFTDQADFELMQTLGQKTNGGYYRAFKAGEIQNIFNNINEIVLKPSETQSSIKKPDKPKGFSVEILLVPLFALIALGIIAIMITWGKRAVMDQGIKLPEAFLIDMDDATNRKKYRIDKTIIKIGRSESDGIDISIPKNTVSGMHAQIVYKDRNFYLTDLNSKNGTYLYLDGEEKRVTNDVLLKSGYMISFHTYKFKFMITGQVSDITEIDPQYKKKVTDRRTSDVKPSQSEKAGLKPSSPPSSHEDAEMKIKYCSKHPSYKATEWCPICKKARCINCMTKCSVCGETVCVDCMTKKDIGKICKKCA